MSSPNRESVEKTSVFPVGSAGRRELRRALVRSTDPAGTIQAFQQSHSLHSMMAKAFGTTPRYKARDESDSNVESLDTDSVMLFLSHLGVTQYDVHKRISDTLLKELEDEIRNAQSQEPLLELLKSSWAYATKFPDSELRPVVLAVLKKLGEETPLAVLTALAERDEGKLRHAEIFHHLSPLLKRLVWEADWNQRIPLEPDTEPKAYLEQVKSSLLFETIEPLTEQYYSSKLLVESANRPFVASIRERRMLTTQRRASTSAIPTTGAATGGVGSVLRGSQQQSTTTTESHSSGKAVLQLRDLLCDSVGSSSSYRPKLLYAILSILIAQHGANEKFFLGGAEHLHCTLVADLLLSTGGPLPKAYTYVLMLARIL